MHPTASEPQDDNPTAGVDSHPPPEAAGASATPQQSANTTHNNEHDAAAAAATDPTTAADTPQDNDAADPAQKRTEADAGHGSQRVANKNGKWQWKQWHRQWGGDHPEPRDQDGPGWGYLYSQRDYPAGATPATQGQPARAKTAANHDRDRAMFRGIETDRPRDQGQPPTTTQEAAAVHQHPWQHKPRTATNPTTRHPQPPATTPTTHRAPANHQ